MIINRKVKRTILENKSQYIGSMVLIVISCLMFTLMNLLADNMNNMTTAFEKNCFQEDASFVTATGLENIPGLEKKFHARIEEASSFDYSLAEGRKLRIFSENTRVNLPAVVEGTSLKGKDILLEPAFAKANKYGIGSTIQIYDRTFRVSGYMSLPNYIYPIESDNDLMVNPQGFGTAVLSKEDFAGFQRGSRFYSIRFDAASGSKDTVAEQFRNELKRENILLSKWTDAAENQRITIVTAKIEGIGKVSTTMPVAILLLTCVLTGVVMRRLIRREAVVIGTLYAQGYRKWEIVRHYLRFPLAVALTGGIAGTVLGALLLKPMLNVMVSFFNIPMTEMLFKPGYLLASLLLPLAFLTVSSLIVLDRELSHKPVELMRGARENGRVNFLERVLKLERFPFPVKFKLREQLRSMSRLLFLLLGVILATMLLLFGFTAKSSMDFLMKDSLKDTYRFQHEYVFNTLQTGKAPEGAEAFSASVFTPKGSKERFEICGIEPGSSYLSLKDGKGNELPKDRVIITRPLADKLKVVPGDSVTAVNRLDSRTYTVTVDLVAETFIGEYVFMPLSRFNQLLELPKGSYMGLWSINALDIPESDLFSSRTIEDSVKAFLATMEPLQAVIGIISFLSFLIGLIAIYVVTSLIIEENRNSISLMKVFGYRKREVNSLILNSSSYIIVLGYVLGIPLVMALLNVLFLSLTDSINLTIPVAVNYGYVLVGFVVVFLTYEIANSLSRRKINRITLSEALKAGTE